MGIMAVPRVMEMEAMRRAGMERDMGGMEVSRGLRLGVATPGVTVGINMAFFRGSGRIEPIWFFGFDIGICMMYLLVLSVRHVLWFAIGDSKG